MISLTDTAAEKAQASIASRYNTLGLRIGVKTTGCSGMAYVLEFCEQATDYDEVFEDKGIRIVVDKKDLVYLDGVIVDYQKKGLNEGYEFINEKEKARCGCGESFTV